MTIHAFDHYTIRCADLQASWRFYDVVLGLRVTERAGMTIPAAIVYLDEMMLIHLFEAGPQLNEVFARLAPPDDEAANWRTGRLHHIAFQARDLPAMRARLTRYGLPFAERTLASQAKHLVVVRDPDGVEIELSFGLGELQAAP